MSLEIQKSTFFFHHYPEIVSQIMIPFFKRRAKSKVAKVDQTTRGAGSFTLGQEQASLSGSGSDSDPNGVSDPLELVQLSNLELKVRILVDGLYKGAHRSPFHGFSAEFKEYRPYTQGEDTKNLDWKLYARTDRYSVRKYEEETNLRCYLIMDRSRSMEFGTQGYSKRRYADTLAGSIAWTLDGQGDAVGLIAYDSEILDWAPAQRKPGWKRKLLTMIENGSSGTGRHTPPPFQSMGELTKGRSLLAIFSDFLTPLETVESELEWFAAQGKEMFVFHVMDPRELDFKWEAGMLMQDLETGETLPIDPSKAREGYLSKLNAHLEALRSICRRLGIQYKMLSTDMPLEDVLREFFHSRQEMKSKKPRRSRGNLG